MSENNEVQEGITAEDDVIVRIKGLHKSYDDLEVLRGIDIDVHRGEVVVVLGPSGSGKSTMLRCINLLEKPTGGQIIFEGTDITAKGVDINGVRAKDFPPLPVDYGYRDSKNFWFHRKSRMKAELLQVRKATLASVRYAADRADDKVKFTDDALETILGVPRVFLSVVLKGCVQWAKENNVELITAEHMKIINDKRAKEKNSK